MKVREYKVAVDVTLTVQLDVIADSAAYAERMAAEWAADGRLNDKVYDPQNYAGCTAQVLSWATKEVM